MKKKKTTILCLASLCAMTLAAQNTSPTFYTVGKAFHTSDNIMHYGDSLHEGETTTASIGATDSLITNKRDFSSFSIEQLEKLIAQYENCLVLRPGKSGSKPKKSCMFTAIMRGRATS